MKGLLLLLTACLLIGIQLGCGDSTPPPSTGSGDGGSSPPPLQGDNSGNVGGGGNGSNCVDGTTLPCVNGSATTTTGANQAGGWIQSDQRIVQAISADANGNVTFPCNGTWCLMTCTNNNLTVTVQPNQTGIWQDAQGGNQRQFTADANGQLIIPCSGQWNAV